MLTIESILDEGKQSDIPENLAIIYNELAEEEDNGNTKSESEDVKVEESKSEVAKEEPAVKKESKKKEEPKKESKKKEEPKKEDKGNIPWREGSSCDKFFQIIVKSGENGISLEEGLKIADKEEIPAKDRLSRIKDVWYTAVKRGFAEKKDGKYFSKK
jgi:outer membrane biosynthesis protein TonB